MQMGLIREAAVNGQSFRDILEEQIASLIPKICFMERSTNDIRLTMRPGLRLPRFAAKVNSLRRLKFQMQGS